MSLMMRTLVLAAIVFRATVTFLVAGDNPAAQQLLVAAEQQSNLFHNQQDAFQMDVSFLAQINTVVPGHLTLKWKARDRWWRKISIGNFEQIDVQHGEMLYTTRNLGFTPVRVRELISLLEFAEGSDRLHVRKQKQRFENGTEMLCFQTERQSYRKDHELCIDSVSHDLASEEWKEPPDERRAERYTDYFAFEEHRYPRKLELLVNGIKALTVNVDHLTTAALDESLLVPPKGAIERRQCAGMQRPIPVKTPDPAYPKSASQNRLMGDTTVAMTVLANGSVTDVRLVGSAARSMDDATLQTLKGWKFKPAMCGTEPVVSDIEVVVSFRLD